MKTNWQDRIEINEKVVVGRPVIRGTRITVDFILELLAQGWTIEHVLKNYPRLTKEDIQAALEYSAEALKTETVYQLS